MEKKVDNSIHKTTQNIVSGIVLAIYFASLYSGAATISVLGILASSYLLATIIQNVSEKNDIIGEKNDPE